METTVVLFGPSFAPPDVEQFALACRNFKSKLEKLLASIKYKPIQIWMVEAHEDGLLYKSVLNVFGRRAEFIKGMSEAMWLESITKVLPSKPSNKNPLFVTLYSTEALAISPAWEFEIIRFNHQCKSFGLDFVYEAELCPYNISDLAVFSAAANPMLRFLRQPSISNIEVASIKPLTGQKVVAHGLALKQGNLLVGLSSKDGPLRLLELTSGVAKIRELEQDALQMLGYKVVDSHPSLLTDPANPIVFQLFKLICLLDSSEKQIDPIMLRNLELILSSFVDKALECDGQLFPVYNGNSAARALGIKRVVRSLLGLEIRSRDLRTSVNTALSRYDTGDEASSKFKKPKPQIESPTNSIAPDFCMRPYLELVPTTQGISIPSSKEDSLFNVYWKMREMHQRTAVPSYKRFWE